MADRSQTRLKILDAAVKLFADKGYRDTTVAEICDASNANIASVNYHFGSKESLYCEAWKAAFEASMKAYPLDGGLDSSATGQQKLHAAVHAILLRILDGSRIGCYGRLLMREMMDKTPAIDSIRREHIARVESMLMNVLRELAGEEVPYERLTMCRFSIIHQCFGFGLHGRRHLGLESMAPDELNAYIARVAEHIIEFSLAGIAAVRNGTLATRPKN